MTKATVLEPTIVKPQQAAVDKWWEKTVASPLTMPNVHGKIMQTINFNLGSFDDEKRTFTAVASTATVDRSGEVIDQASWNLDNFKTNPVIPWAHDYFQPPVARAIEIGVVNGILQFTYQAPPPGMYEFADLVWNFYRNQYMFAFSVGFLASEMQGNTFLECELLEISAVVVPANPQALMLAYKMGDLDLRHARQLKSKLQTTITNLEEIMDMSKVIEGDEHVEAETASKSPKTVESAQQAVDTLSKLIEGAVEKAMNKHEEATDVEVKGAISSNLPIAPKDTGWDKGEAIKAIKKWAADADGNIDFGKYKKCFMYVADGGGDKQGDYKLPFADIVGDSPKAVWNAVRSIMSVLNGGMGGANISDADRKSVYTQVKKYYKKFGEDAPPLKSIDDIAVQKDLEEEAEDKGGVAQGIAADNAMDAKRMKMNDVFEVFWAFCDVYFDENTAPTDFNSLLDETVALFQKISAGTYNLSDGDTDDDDDDSVGLVVTSLRSLKSSQAKLRFAQFMVKVLTGKVLRKDNVLMGKKDLSEGSDGGSALTPTQMAHLKAVHDYLMDTKALLDMHTDALTGHAQTMKAHADMLAKQSKGLAPHADVVKAIVNANRNNGGNGDTDDDGISDVDHLDDTGGNNTLDEQNYPDSSLGRSLDKPSETKATDKKAKGEVKSEENPTDGADQGDDAVDEEVEEASVEDKAAKGAVIQKQPDEAPEEETPEEGKDTDEEEAKPEEAESALTDDTEVDPDNLSDEAAEEIIRAVNDALSAEAK